MKRWSFFVYGVASYLLFLGTYVYLAGFLANQYVPKTINSTTTDSVATAVTINLLLMGLFAAQHSIMARPAFKRIWTRLVPEPIERSTYVLLSCVATGVLIWQWRGIDTVVWNVEQPVVRTVLWGLFAAGWLLVPAVSLLINHFDLFGTRQVWLYLRGHGYKALPFRTPLVYKRVRHPLYVAWAMLFWSAPTMTVGHLLFAGVLTIYMGLAALVEERDLVTQFGKQYEDYRQRVPMFVPSLTGTTSSSPQPVYQLETTAAAAEKEACHA